MFWDVEFTDQFETWWGSLAEEEQDEIDAAVTLLQERGPGLGRPLVDSVHQSRFANMKELRLGTTRILFAFDPRRVAILLIGGDKRNSWTRWYDDVVPIADKLYQEHLDEINEITEKRE
jgi:hypothetical protein